MNKRACLILLLISSSLSYAANFSISCGDSFESNSIEKVNFGPVSTSTLKTALDSSKDPGDSFDSKLIQKAADILDSNNTVEKPEDIQKKFSAPVSLTTEEYFNWQYYRMVRGNFYSVKPVGLMLFFGIGTKKDKKFAYELLDFLSDPAHYTLGKAYYKGIRWNHKVHLKPNYVKAYNHFKKAAKYGHDPSLNEISIMRADKNVPNSVFTSKH